MTQPRAGWQSFSAFKRRPYFNVLDGLRALSILMVLLHHVPHFAADSALRILQENGRYGVGFFFVISGFLICTLLLREEEKTGAIGLGKFYGRRALRLLPLYYVALLVQAVLVFWLKQYSPENQELFREKLPAYLFYYSNLPPTAMSGPFFCAWSLAVEEQFYLVFGLLLFWASRRFVIGAVAAALVIKVLAYGVWGQLDADSTLWRVVFSYQEPILLGVLAAFALNRRPTYETFARGLGFPLVPAILGAGLAVWLCLHAMSGQNAWDAQLLYALMTLLLVSLVVQPDLPLLRGRSLVHIGKISYGIYLLHMFVLSSVKKLPGGAQPGMCFLLTAAFTVALASVVYRYFEQPIIRFYKQRLSPLAKESTPREPIVALNQNPVLNAQLSTLNFSAPSQDNDCRVSS